MKTAPLLPSQPRRMPVSLAIVPAAAAHGGDSASGWMVQCDFDGTISTVDVTDSLLQRFGQPGWEALEDAWERGEIGSRECMKGQVALLDMDRAELDAHLASIEVDPHFAAFVQEAQSRGMPVQVVSDGIDYAIQAVLERHGLGALPVVANRLVQAGPRQWRLESPWASGNCSRASGNCKCERLAEQRARHGRVLFVGDSTSDFCVSGQADFVFAKYKLIAHCESQGIAHAPFTDFSDTLELLRNLEALAPRALELAA
ncbi:Haloacid Dehalogenase superfamily, subfamily IB, phosphoserine phosphatase-like/2,3-diketo-5-methylthio-1-phosphopentane phosphatase [Paracidovorax konjaci]|uniref:Haloacid Dehalogenase superfamily, subfamily IB, phosphoserine phosphatase-like/2,3-diketo-5-methylthio-1-phosphopentane phosphatase n=2 Tax=Paracidovorax konjaci TaxID=32040 RepID=A0A1I1VUF6_9BURK|nr:Haloacid Dehalogenase superfamily, subfamily IB, phosphoserine phosphatase-like/2,3-diketo-5-methylthio-1-phosphopentane phosphatase [Paracidovorax konjaci]